jgi:hypothetical protein
MINKNSHSRIKAQKSIEGCRAVEIDNQHLAECLFIGPNSCSYALPFGYCFLCQHPRLSEIVENTRKGSKNINH